MSAELRDGRSAAERACSAQACAIQHCLQQRSYAAAPCASTIAAYADCVAAAEQRVAPTTVERAALAAAGPRPQGSGSR